MTVKSLGSLLKTSKGKKPTDLLENVAPGLVPYLDIFAVERGIVRQWADPSDARVVPAGTLVMVWDGARAGWVGTTQVSGALGSTLVALDSSLDRRYFAAFLRAHFADINSNHRGSGIPHVNPDYLNALEIPILSNAQQEAVGELSDALDQRARSAGGHLLAARTAVDKFRQAILAAACAGRLTQTWRDRREPEPVVLALARRHIDMPRKLGKRHRDAFSPNPNDLPEIPEGWSWVALPELGELGRGKSKHRPRNDPKLYGGDYPFIQTGDIARSDGRVREYSQTYNEVGLAQSRLWPSRTVCITIAANIANSSLLTFPACFPDSVVGLIADESVAVPEYIELFIRTARRDLAAFAPATAQANINLAILSELAVALPPVTEQREIVRQVEGLYARAETILAAIHVASARVDRSWQATLAKAFRGELVSEPRD